MPYNGKDNNNYADGSGFCCDDKPKDGATTRSLNPGQNDNPEKFQYYYHPDHLGSSSYITNLDGNVVQHIEYVPFGEVFVEERNNRWNTPYLFNAKELDEETGLYYYGARYYNPRISFWLSTDPLQEKYPNISSYVYCVNNPVRFVDPDGRDWYSVRNKEGQLEYRYSLDIHSQKDLDKVQFGAKYLGKTYAHEDNYFSLFGTIENLKENQGKLTQKIDESIINYQEGLTKMKNAKYSFGEDISYEKSTNFDIGVYQTKSGIGLNENTLLKGEYQGGTIYYFIPHRNMDKPNTAKFGGFTSEYRTHGNYTGYGKMNSGFTLYLPRTWGRKDNDAAKIVFENKNQIKEMYDKFNRLFNIK